MEPKNWDAAWEPEAPVPELTLLGNSQAKAPTELLESFERPPHCHRVVMSSDEVTAVCPVTGQPDFYKVDINYVPTNRCIESKSLKLKLQSYRDKGLFVEALASEIAGHVVESINPVSVEVSITQKPRGGVQIVATAKIGPVTDYSR